MPDATSAAANLVAIINPKFGVIYAAKDLKSSGKAEVGKQK
jgi:hypothetical protein